MLSAQSLSSERNKCIYWFYFFVYASDKIKVTPEIRIKIKFLIEMILLKGDNIFL